TARRVALCLARAAVGRGAPVPLGPAGNPESALGRVAAAGPEPVVIVVEELWFGGGDILAVAIGTRLSGAIPAALRRAGAVAGDAWLQDVAVEPDAEDAGLRRDEAGKIRRRPRAAPTGPPPLAALALDAWCADPSIGAAPRIFAAAPGQHPLAALCAGAGFLCIDPGGGPMLRRDQPLRLTRPLNRAVGA
ncbi:MAG: hypothetical protein AAF281_12195, partial [Pseudomonadota bacterium]